LTGKCPTITRGGDPCRGLVRPGNDYCPAHDPARQEARRRAASKAGKSKPGRELVDIKKRLLDLAGDVLEGRKDRGDAAVAGQLFNYAIRAVSVGLKVKEIEEIEERITELEGLLERQQKRGAQYESA
jgi:hypothetical protein